MNRAGQNNRVGMCAMADMLDGRWYYVPSYQRGYRWCEDHVCKLLGDLYSFALNKGKSLYCMQPLVVKSLKNVDHLESRYGVKLPQGKVWEVVDGQQRLTAMNILLRYLVDMKRLDMEVLNELYGVGDLYGIVYETRPDSLDFLRNIGRSREAGDIDTDHMRRTYDEIDRWLKNDAKTISERYGQSQETVCIAGVLLNLLCTHGDVRESDHGTVQFIWYELDPDSSTGTVKEFRRLNSGKIPLTAAELVKAMLLSRNHPEAVCEPGDAPEVRARKKSRMESRILEMSLQWEQMENALHRPEFWYFISPDTSPSDNRMGTLLRLAAQNMTGGESEPEVFKHYHDKISGLTGESLHDAILDTWNGIVEVFRVLEDWFSKLDVYNWIGFLVHAPKSKQNVYSLYKKWSEVEDHSAFLRCLKQMAVRDVLRYGTLKPDELTYKESKEVRTVLLFLNVRLCDCERTGRFPFDRYALTKWDIEHVDSLTPPKEPEDCQKLCDLNAGAWMPDDVAKRVDAALCSEDGAPDYKRAWEILSAMCADNDEDGKDNIRNLTLLESSINRSYGNALFGKKRAVVQEKVRSGSYVPQATQMVFTKAFTPSPTDLLGWSLKNDGKAYVEFIVKQMEEFYMEAFQEKEKA